MSHSKMKHVVRVTNLKHTMVNDVANNTIKEQIFVTANK